MDKLQGSPQRERDSSINFEEVSGGSRCCCSPGGQQHSLSLKTFSDKKQGASPGRGTSIEKIQCPPEGGINNIYSSVVRGVQQRLPPDTSSKFIEESRSRFGFSCNVLPDRGTRLILPPNLLKNRALAWYFLALGHRITAPA